MTHPRSLAPISPLNLRFVIDADENRDRIQVWEFRRSLRSRWPHSRRSPPMLFAPFVVAVDPYFVFGSPSWRGFNEVRPYYEPHVLIAKPYQVRRQRPSAVALGSSRVEVGIDPARRLDRRERFQFRLPSSNSYAVMLAFLHAQKVSAPLKQAVVGLDFFAYNINFPLAADLSEQRFAQGIADEFEAFLDGAHPDRRKTPPRCPSRFRLSPCGRAGTKRSMSPSTVT